MSEIIGGPSLKWVICKNCNKKWLDYRSGSADWQPRDCHSCKAEKLLKDIKMSDQPIVEKNVRACKVCKVLKERVQDGKYNDKDKKWRDEKGLLWMGNTCGECNRTRLKEVMRKKRKL